MGLFSKKKRNNDNQQTDDHIIIPRIDNDNIYTNTDYQKKNLVDEYKRLAVSMPLYSWIFRKRKKAESPSAPSIPSQSVPIATSSQIEINQPVVVSHKPQEERLDTTKLPNQSHKPPVTSESQLSETTPEINQKITDDYESYLGKVVSAEITEKIPKVISFISTMFFGISFTYATLTLLIFGTIIALAITLSNVGAPGFIYLKYYPNIGILPVLSGLATLLFFYISYKIKDGSRFSWILGSISLIVLPISFSLIMPVMTYPLVRLVTAFAGSASDKLFPDISVSLEFLKHFFSIFLIFEIVLFILILTIGLFKHKSSKISETAKTSMIVIFILFFLPIASTLVYGYYDANNTDFGLRTASIEANFRIYSPQFKLGDRTHASKYLLNEELAGRYNAVKTVFDIPLPSMVKKIDKNPIILFQVDIEPDFSLYDYVVKQDQDAGTQIEQIEITMAQEQKGFITQKSDTTFLRALMPEQILIEISSKTASKEEIIQFAQSLR